MKTMKFDFFLIFQFSLDYLTSDRPYSDRKLYKILSFTFNTAQKMKFSIKDFFSKFDQIPNFLRIWSHLLKKSIMENFIFCAA